MRESMPASLSEKSLLSMSMSMPEDNLSMCMPEEESLLMSILQKSMSTPAANVVVDDEAVDEATKVLVDVVSGGDKSIVDNSSR